MNEFESMSQAMGQKFEEDVEFRKLLHENISKIYKENNLDMLKLEHIEQSFKKELAVQAKKDVVSFKGYWWGYIIRFPEPVMNDLNTVGDITIAVGGMIAAIPPLAPVAPLIAAYVALEFTLMKSMDKGKGVGLGSSWVTPGVFIPAPL
ncbi:MAG: hypothetical protein K8R11_03685 [Methanococcoides sp.]|nr:hypothetical protein [Methanococcoides sp.]